MSDLFSVYQFFPDDTWECVHERIEAREAVESAKRLTESIGGRLGTTHAYPVYTHTYQC